jgi:penicillin-insensitive murein endopeptidase
VKAALLGPLGTAAALAFLSGCLHAPSSLNPIAHGSIGTPNRGVLTGGAELERDTEGLKWLRENDRHWGLPRFTHTIERAAARVARERPGASLYVGDLSARTGGVLIPHFSHRSGRDADLLFYMTTLEGAPVDSPGFIHVGADGLAHDEVRGRWLRFDVAREWALVKALVEDPEARVQWLFVSEVVEALLLEWARAIGDPAETIWRAQQMMLEPHPGGVHDDHIHVRVACTPEEIAAGCEPTGTPRPWLATAAPPEDRIEDLVLALLRPF